MLLRAIRFLYLILYCVPILGTAQSVDLTQFVSFKFTDTTLEDALSKISQQYHIPFAYSRDFIPVDHRITVEVNRVSLEIGLDRLFESTQVIYAAIGTSIALRVDKDKEVVTSIQEPTKKEIPSEKIEPPIKREYRNYTKITPLRKEGYLLLFSYHLIEQAILDSLKRAGLITRDYIPNIYEDSPYRELSQVTFVPTVSTNKEKADSITNTFSLNILYGINGGVEGIEVGGFGNEILNNMKGLQISGLINKVYGTVSGTQFASVLNHNLGYTRGLQFTLGVNLTNETKAVQMAGLLNIVKEDFAGLQAALIGNSIRRRGNGIQLAIIFNNAQTNIQRQFALFYNEAGEVQQHQVGFINKANYVKGGQFGILNIAEEVKGTPIGLFNIIKKGYNRIEVAGGESLFTNFGFKLGKRKFYNKHIHLEWVTSHVNEEDWWTTNKNWLHQLKCSYDWNFGEENYSLFLGPNFNWSVSTIRPSEMAAFSGSNLPSYTLVDTNRPTANWKLWIGATAGLRF